LAPAEQRQDYEGLNRRWRPALVAYFLRRVSNHAEAEDLTQEVFVRMLNIDESRGTHDGYVFQIAHNLLVDQARRTRIRHRYRETLASPALDATDMLDPQRITLGRAELARFAAALEELPERTRTMFTLHRIDEMNQDLIGEAFGISKSAVKKQIASAMAFLMARMRDD
jgi:RNA polymerase sigma-70 factor (ECF subfamily)